jgi:hypothetical protein
MRLQNGGISLSSKLADHLFALIVALVVFGVVFLVAYYVFDANVPQYIAVNPDGSETKIFYNWSRTR